MDFETVKIIAVAVMMTIVPPVVALAQGSVVGKTMEAIGRNPSVSADIFPKMIVGLAMLETSAIYTLLIAFIMLFVL